MSGMPWDLSQMVVAKLGADGKVNIRTSALTDLVVDVQGYFTTADVESGARFHSVAATRLWDTRSGGSGVASCVGVCDRLSSAGETITLDIDDVAVFAAGGVEALVLNVIAVNTTTTGSGFLQVYPTGATPGASALNFQNGETLSNTATVAVNSNGQFTVRVDHGGADVVVDVQGWFEAATRTWTYSYDGDGLRASKTAPDDTTSDFTWDRSGGVPLLLSQNSGGVRTDVIYGPGGHPYAEITGATVHYHHRDRLGSTTTLTDAAGSVVHAASYTVNGEIEASTGAVAPLLGWAGEQRDPETGLVYLRARFYDPTTSQFLTRDPAVELTGEPYAYASNNPVTYIDPLGLWGIRLGPIKIGNDGCLLGTNPNGSCRGSGAVKKAGKVARDVGGRAIDVIVATVNAPVTASTAAVNSWTGGDCDWAKSLTVVCYGGAISGLSNRTFVTGSTINTSQGKVDYANAYDGNLHRHETWHTRQWAIFGGGALFPLFYGAEALRTWGDECQNWFEIWAGLEDGGY